MSIKEKKVGLWILPSEPELNAIVSYDLLLEVRRSNTVVDISQWQFIPFASVETSTELREGIALWNYKFRIPLREIPTHLRNAKSRLLVIFNASETDNELYLFPAGIAGIPVQVVGNEIVLEATLFKIPNTVYPPYLVSKQPTDEEVLNTSEISSNSISINALRYYAVPVN
jgi:hypothetical protein